MTWEDIKKATLAKMFGVDSGQVDLADDNNIDYVAAMPYAANEAISQVCNAGFWPRKYVEIEVTEDETGYLLTDYAKDYFSSGTPEAYILNDKNAPVPVKVNMVANYLVVPDGTEGTVIFYYNAKPTTITPDTENDAKMPFDDDLNALLPLYMAGELYRDDSRVTAVYWYNEFASALASMQKRQTGYYGGEFVSESGW